MLEQIHENRIESLRFPSVEIVCRVIRSQLDNKGPRRVAMDQERFTVAILEMSTVPAYSDRKCGLRSGVSPTKETCGRQP